ncbi:hypothetical protein [Nocardia sp. CC227C]|uniref:hypothetical protein n=1 Tax=Nocardia sp. CC227C TaxID=3044562 RepID=UPI00278C6FD1|nr:hypothetical protein [Nocardia sp. CC227C]
MTGSVNRQWVLRHRPDATVRDEDFELRSAPIPSIASGEALIRVRWLGIDATQRGWLNDADNYMDAVPLGAVMRGSGVGQVVASEHPGYPVGSWVFFDGVGGPILEHGLAHLAHHARVVLTGAVATGYQGTDPSTGPRNYPRLALTRSRLEGFIFLDYVDRFPEAFTTLLDWHTRGHLTLAETITPGLESAPSALRSLFEGHNLGKQLVQVAGR